VRGHAAGSDWVPMRVGCVQGARDVVAGARATTQAGGVELRVELAGVSKTFGAVRALAGVGATFDAGRVSVVRGANGSGKSTLLAIVATLARPTSGRVDHGALGRRRDDVRASLGWVGHESLCYAELSGRENVELAARLYGCEPTEAFARASRRFDLGAFADRAVRTYSRGQRQRVALARALVHGPRLLLLDEPTTGLDVDATARLAAVIREEAERGAIVVVVTHDAVFSDAVADHVVELERGRVVNRRGARAAPAATAQ
jgi:heme ABC exporter ATP-binding subunit CcmA